MNKLVIPGELTDLNTYINAERRNRFIASKIKKEETNRVAWEAKSQKLPKVREPLVEVMIDWYVPNEKKDADNIIWAKKFILDGLVEAGILPSDGRKYITAFTDAVYVDKKYPRVEVSL